MISQNARPQKAIISIAFLLMIVPLSFCSENDTAAADTTTLKHHRLQINPLALITGGLYGSYEYRISKYNALAIEGQYTFPLLGTRTWLAGASYRRYYKPNKFFGAFVKDGFLSAKIPSTERGDTTNYMIQISYLTIGANWGKVWYVKNRFPLTLRIGAGYPAISELTWKNNLRHPSAGMFEGIYRFTAALDSELSIGVRF